MDGKLKLSQCRLSLGHPGVILGHLEIILGSSWVILGYPGVKSGYPVVILGSSLVILRSSLVILGHPGDILGHHGVILGSSRVILESSWGHPWSSWSHPGLIDVFMPSKSTIEWEFSTCWRTYSLTEALLEVLPDLKKVGNSLNLGQLEVLTPPHQPPLSLRKIKSSQGSLEKKGRKLSRYISFIHCIGNIYFLTFCTLCLM